MREAISRAGYLMEQRLVPVVERFGFKVTPNQRYHDPTTGKSLELDLFAISGRRIGKRGLDLIFPVLLIACKNLRCPLIFFTHREMPLHWFVGTVHMSGLPFELQRALQTETIVKFFRFEEFHHYYRTGHIASQFCAVYETNKKDRPKFEAGHTIAGRIELFSEFDALARIVELEKRKHAKGWNPDPDREVVNLQIYYPVFVTAGPLFECFVGKGRVKYRRVHRVGYLHRTDRASGEQEYRFDIVDRLGLKRLLEIIEVEGQEMEKRVRKNRGLFRENVLRLTKDLMRKNIETRVRLLSSSPD
jgi:hypothetical protein